MLTLHRFLKQNLKERNLVFPSLFAIIIVRVHRETIPMIVIQSEHISPLSKKDPIYYTVEKTKRPTEFIAHESARVWYVASGEATLQLNESTYNLKQGSCISLFPWDVTRFIEIIEPIDLHIIVYRFSAINTHFRMLEHHHAAHAPIFKKLKEAPVTYEQQYSKRIGDIIEQIGLLQSKQSLYEKIEQESLLIQLLCLLVKKEATHAIQSPKNDSTLTLAIDVMQYMSKHLTEKLTLDYVAQQLFTNKTTLAQTLREVLEHTFVQLLSRMRLHKAIELLLVTQMTSDEIAQAIGYFDSSHFTKQFEHIYKLTPQAYRKKYSGIKPYPLEDIEEVMRYITNHYIDESIRAHQVAKKHAISVTTLNQWLLFYTESTFDEWIHRLRIHLAASLLRTTDQTILDIAITVGYTNTRTFQRIFEQHFHTTPSNYRKR